MLFRMVCSGWIVAYSEVTGARKSETGQDGQSYLMPNKGETRKIPNINGLQPPAAAMTGATSYTGQEKLAKFPE